MFVRDPDKIYIHCDGSMDYGSDGKGAIGIHIVFPESLNMQEIKKSIGSYEKSNIERIELQGILKGLVILEELYKKNYDELKNSRNIVITTDRFSLVERINPYKIREWRKNRWKNHEGKAVKNSDLLEKIDKKINHIRQKYWAFIEVIYLRRKYNKTADKLAELGKDKPLRNEGVSLIGFKACKRKFDGGEVKYNLLTEKTAWVLHIFKRELVRNQWEIVAEFCEGEFKGEKVRIYLDSETRRKIHINHNYKVKIKKVFTHHIALFKTIKEIKSKIQSVQES